MKLLWLFMISFQYIALLSADDNCVDEDITIKIIGPRQSAAMFKEYGTYYKANSSFYKRTVSFQYTQSDKTFWGQMVNKSASDTSFVLSEIPPTVDEDQDHPELLTFPIMMGALAFVYNLGNVTNLLITHEVIAGIYMGNITYWDDDDIQTINPNLKMPHEKIIVCAKKMNDSTDMDTEFLAWLLSLFNKNSKDQFGQSDWPRYVNHVFFKQSTQMVPFVSSTRYSFGYVSWDNLFNKATPPTVASVRTFNFGVTNPVEKNVLSSEKYMETKGDFRSEAFKALMDIGAKTSGYPFIHLIFVTINRTLSSVSYCTAQEALGFIDYFMFDYPAGGRDTSWTKYGYSPLNQSAPEKRNLLYGITWNGIPPFRDFEKSRVLLLAPTTDNWKLVLIIAVSVISVLIGLLGFIFYQKKYRMIDESMWVIPSSELTITDMKSKAVVASVHTIHTMNSFTKQSPEDLYNVFAVVTGYWKKNDIKVFIKEMSLNNISNWKQSTKRLTFKFIRDFNHPNVCLLHGVSIIENKICLIFEHCAKGTLNHVLKNCPFDLLLDIKFSLANNVLSGLKYLHQKFIVHGSLSSVVCYVDDMWNVKISDWPVFSIVSNNPTKQVADLLNVNETSNTLEVIKMVYLDPESICPHKPTFSSDVYSFGIMLIEIFSSQLPYHEEVELGSTTYAEIIEKKFTNNCTPQIPHDVPQELQQLVSNMIGQSQNKPNISMVVSEINKLRKSNKSVVDIMMKLMEKHMEDLEEKVIERTIDLQTVTNRMKELLNEMLPPQIATKFIRGEAVLPEFYECATIFFSDIVGFTTISARSTPLQVMNFLNHLWTIFDATVVQFDCYKVDTIGDAYMVASGLPERNGIQHCQNVSNFALTLLKKTCDFIIPHLPGELLRIRIGINSGPVTTGVIGHKMPQYCVFGDTVNTASRMESTSIPLKIQVSEYSHNLIVQYFPEFLFELRGEVEIKGKGTMKTYWLLKKEA